METDITAYQEFIENYAIPWGIKIIAAIAIFIIGKIIAKVIVKGTRKLMDKANVDKTLSDFLGNIFQAILMVVVVIAALEQLGVNTTSVLAVFAAAGLAIGLAFKDSLSNFAAGIMLIMFKPFKSGDFVETAGVSGIIEHVRIFNTVMRTGDNREITVPNSHIYSDIITNYSARDTRRIDMTIGIGYEDNIGKAKSIIEDIISKDNRLLEDPAPTIMLMELGESSIDIAVRPWVKSDDYWVTRADLLQTIKERFDAEGISIPYP
ncbi:MAG: mechanosensitive ion channel, partial [Thioalkalispiraceae bacterium]